MSSSVVLVAGAYAWQNWASYEVSAEFATPAASWSCEVHNPSLAQLAALSTGLVVQLLVGDEVALKGALDRVQVSRSRSAGTVVSLSGRDLAAALVDCAPSPGWSHRNLSLGAVASAALLKLGIAATVEADSEASTPLPLVKPETGETYWQILDRYARRARLMVWMTPAGVLRIGRPDYVSAPVATLINGRTGALAAATNVLSSTWSDDLSGRYSDVLVLGQAAGSDDFFGEGACQLRGTAQDAGVVAKGLYRPTVLDEGELRSSAEASARAAWEVSRRQHEAEQLEYAVPGHTASPGVLWAPNQQVSVQDELVGQYGTWWIAARTFSRDRQGGSRTQLTLRRPNTLLPAVV